MAAIPFANAIDLMLNEIQNGRFQVLAADPGSPVEAQFWYNSTTKTLNFRTSTGTIALGGAGATDAGTLDGLDSTYFLDRANHSGTQAQSTITGLVAALALLAPLASPALTGNPTAPTPATSDNDTSIATTAFVKANIAALVGTAGATLDTLQELAAALGNDANFATTVTNSLASKVGKFSQTIGDGAATSFVITHNLGSTDTIVQVKDIATKKKIMVDIEDTTANTTTIVFASAPALNSYRVTIHS